MSHYRSRVEARTSSLGALGRWLAPCARRLAAEFDLEGAGKPMPLSVEWAMVGKCLKGDLDVMSTVSASILLLKVPVHVDVGVANILRIAHKALVHDVDDVYLAGRRLRLDELLGPGGGAVRAKWFPFKKHPAVSTKVNVYLDVVLKALRKDGFSYLCETVVSKLAGKVADDVCCGALIYAAALQNIAGSSAADLACGAVLNPHDAKGLSVTLKALGLNATRVGSMLVEANCLQGRMVGDADMAGEAAARTSSAGVAKLVVNLPDDTLRQAVRAVLREELPEGVLDFETIDSFWAHRWAWCVNGSHNTTSEKVQGLPVPNFPGTSRIYRRMFAEWSEAEPITGWNGHVVATMLSKLEHGKTRALESCDSRSYFAFEHLLGTVQRHWRNRRVILDPGKFGNTGLAEDIGRVCACTDGGVNLMLDYDSFNEHHSTHTMKVLFEELVRWTGYDSKLGATLVSSFDTIDLYLAGKRVGHVLGTLMSGHRGTSFINSVLNAVYVRLAMGQTEYELTYAKHVGDDVYMRVASLEKVDTILDSLGALGCRLNATKQSVGWSRAEFLRMGIGARCGFGYLSRSIASAVSGNWLSEKRLCKDELLQSFLVHARALMNRGCGVWIARVLATSFSEITRVRSRWVRSLMAGAAAMVGGPQYEGRLIQEVKLVKEELSGEELGAELLAHWPTYATDTYLRECLHPVERQVMDYTGLRVKRAMLDASYGRALADVSLDNRVSIRLVGVTPRRPIGSVGTREVRFMRAAEGVLSRYPVLQLMRNSLRGELLRWAVELAGGDPGADDLEVEAWGARAHACLVNGVLPYADAASYARRTTHDVLDVGYALWM